MKHLKHTLVFALGGASLLSASASEPQSLQNEDGVEIQYPVMDNEVRNALDEFSSF